MLKTIMIICTLCLFAALSLQGKAAVQKCEELHRNNQSLLVQCETLGN